jgi:hypothetical protein
MTRRWLCLAAIVGVCSFTREGFADDLQGTRFEPSEVQHRIRVVLDRGHATLLVERVVFNPGTKSDQAVFSLDVPEGAVAISLKTLGQLNGRPHWFYGDLKEAEVAAHEYHELTGFGGYYPKDPALLSWRSATNLFLQVFPCMPKQNKALGYTLEMPMDYTEGRYHLTLPELGLADRPATFTVEAVHGGDRLFVNEKLVDAGRIFPADGDTALALEPYRRYGITGELAVADTGFGRTFTHVRYMLAKQLSQVPTDAYVVVGIDNSRSMGTDRESAVKMAERTLQLFPNAQVQVLDFDRKPRPRFAGFAPVRTAIGALKRELSNIQVPEAGNGSEVDLALAEAERLLAAVPGARTKRILFFSDALVPERITPAAVAASVGKSGAIVHIVDVTRGLAESFERDDEHPWAGATRVTGGLVWQTAASDRSDDDEAGAKRNGYLPLVRPTTLYKAVYSFPTSPQEDQELGDLEEGSGFERQGIYDGAIRWARLSGELWSKPFGLTVHPDARAGKLWSALVFGTEELNQLTEAEMMVLAKRGGAVSPVTSYLAIEPGVRPSTDGLTRDEAAGGLGLSGIGEGGGGRGEGFGLGTIGRTAPFDPQAFLEKQLAAKWENCKGEAGQASVTLETHFVEVADVTVKLDIQEPDKFDCLSEATWSLDLRGHRFEDRRQTWEIQL